MMTRLNLIAVMIAAVLAIGVVGVAMTEEVYAGGGERGDEGLTPGDGEPGSGGSTGPIDEPEPIEPIDEPEPIEPIDEPEPIEPIDEPEPIEPIDEPEPIEPIVDAKVRAIQNGNVLGTQPGEEGTIGQDIDCVGGVGTAHANDFHCFLVPGGIDIGTIDWADPNTINNPPAGVRVISTDTLISCAGLPGGLHTETTCFKVTFPASDFTPGKWHFIGVFTLNGNIIDLADNDFRVHSFMVVPELIIGSIGLVGSTLGTLYIYKSKSKSKKSE
jgi:hypothetical protein